MAYLETVLYPKMNEVFSTLSCAKLMKYGDQNEFFPDLLVTEAEVTNMCTNNYYVQYEDALTWKKTGVSICQDWNPLTSCLKA
jgi:hypothetical protein